MTGLVLFQNKYMKFFGICTDEEYAVSRCFAKEVSTVQSLYCINPVRCIAFYERAGGSLLSPRFSKSSAAKYV